MHYYRYNDKYELIEKSELPLTGKNIVNSEEDIDIQLFRVIVGYINDEKEMLLNTKFVKGTEVISRRLIEIVQQQVELELETDFRLSMLELGLA
ncbi:MAG: hypothetical protein K0R00_3360 [Herbinix sp.]|jgi:hypothetical protein|nr:hypothetical protein [Herbinix sp.]